MQMKKHSMSCARHAKNDVSKHQNVPEGPRRPRNAMTEKGARRAGKVAHQPARSKCTWTSKRTFVRAGADKRATTRPLNEPGLYSYNKNPSVWTAFAEKSRNNSGPLCEYIFFVIYARTNAKIFEHVCACTFTYRVAYHDMFVCLLNKHHGL